MKARDATDRQSIFRWCSFVGDHRYDAEGTAGGRPDRPVFASGKWHQARVVMRHQLAPGDSLTGPALVEEPDSTTYVPPDFALDVDGSGCLVLTEQRPQAAS